MQESDQHRTLLKTLEADGAGHKAIVQEVADLGTKLEGALKVIGAIQSERVQVLQSVRTQP